MPCDAIATAQAKVNLGALVGSDIGKLQEIVTAACRKQFAGEYFTLTVSPSGQVNVRGRRAEAILSFAEKVIKVLGQKALAAKVAKQVRVTKQTVAPNGAIVMEVEL